MSLAIWMGGVTRELDLLSQASRWRRQLDDRAVLPEVQTLPEQFEKVRRLYLGLLDILDVTVDIDVLSGTSAGGINASLLAYSRVHQKDLGGLRGIWLDVGSLLTLLRDPADKDVPSLLLGDEQMYGQLSKKLPALAKVVGPALEPPGRVPSTSLFVTTTLLSGETSRFTDDFGTLVQDVDYHGLFRFNETDLLRESAPCALALAARSSASFPAAFEPSFIPFITPTPQLLNVPSRPDMAPFSEITRSHWAADGGLLNNRPIGPLLQAVFDQPATREVRRVLLYVVPTAGGNPDPIVAQPGDDLAKPYGFAEGLFKELGAVLKQSITSDLRTIRDHNDKVRVRTDTRLQIAGFAAWLPAGQSMLTPGLLADYRAREADVLAQPIVAAIMRQLTTWPPEPGAGANPGNPEMNGIPQEWQAELEPGGGAEPNCKKAITDAFTRNWAHEPATLRALATYGRPAYDGAKAAAIAILRTALDAASTREQKLELADLFTQVHSAFEAAPRIDLRAFVSKELASLSLEKTALSVAAATVGEKYLAALGEPKDVAAGASLEKTWQALAQTFITGAEMLHKIAGMTAGPQSSLGAPSSTLGRESTPKDKLKTYLGYLSPLDVPADVAKRIFELYAVQRAMLPLSADVEQPVELIQLSADTRSLLDLERSTAASKLTGEQLHHFGAFYKQSWRANDWMWGRLDAAGWLVHLLLDPRRIQAVAEAQPARHRADWLIGELRKLGVPPLRAEGAGIKLGPDQELNEVTVRAELAFLDNASVKAPMSIPLTALWVSKSIQEHIAIDELPVLADCVVNPQNDGPKVFAAKKEHIPAFSKQWAERVAKAHAAGTLEALADDLLRTCPVPDETLKNELGTPLMVRTVAKAAADATAAMNSVKQLPAVVRPVFSSARTVTLAGYRLTKSISPAPKVMILSGLALLVTGVILALQQAALLGLGGAIIAATGAYLLVFGAWQASRVVLTAVLGVTLVIAAASLSLPSTRRGLFGTSDVDTGVVGRQVHWLSTSGWHPIIALGVVLLAFAIIGLVFDPVGRRKKQAKRGWNDRVSHWWATGAAIVSAAAAVIALCFVYAHVYHDEHRAQTLQNSAVGRAVLASMAGQASALPSALAVKGLEVGPTDAAAQQALTSFTNRFFVSFADTLKGTATDTSGKQVETVIGNLAGPWNAPEAPVAAAVCDKLNHALSATNLQALTRVPLAKPGSDALVLATSSSLLDADPSPACQGVASWLAALKKSVSPAQAGTAIQLAETAALIDAESEQPTK